MSERERKTLANSTPVPDELTARQLIVKLKLHEHIKRVVDEAPPLNAEQRERLSLLLTPERAFAQPHDIASDDVLDVLKEGRK